MHFLIVIAKRIISALGYDVLPKRVPVCFLGKQYVVRNGTVDDGDYDDAWMFALAHDASVIFDVGANIGQSAFTMLHAPNVECVVLIDPTPFALTIAADTLIRNQMSHRAKFINAYVDSQDGDTVAFEASGHGTGAHPIQDEHKRSVVHVPTRTLDNIATALNMWPDFVKVDADGCERRVLDGAVEIARRAQTRFLIEMHSSPERPQRVTTGEVLEWCEQHSYATWYLKEGIRLTSAEAVAHRGRYHVLVQPDTWPYPDFLQGIEQGAPVSSVKVATT